MKKVDVLVIGGGPGGYVAAIKAAQLGKKTAIVEKEHLGGTCLNWGCIPTKSLLRNAEVISHLFEGKEFGFSLDEGSISVDYAKAQKRSRKVSDKLVHGIDYLMKKNHIEVLRDEAVFTAPKTVSLKKMGETVQASNIIIAAGARPNRLPGMDFCSSYVLDSKKALQLTKAPKSVVVIGAGAIGMEFATVWRAYGAEVTVVEMLPRVLPNEDHDVSKEAHKGYNKNGIKILTQAKVSKVVTLGAKTEVTVTTLDGEQKLECEYLLVSAGIKPNSDCLNIEKTGVKVNDRGYIEVDDKMRTNVSGIYAIGDITGKLALAHAASAQGILAANDIAGNATDAINYDNIPKCTFGLPETASAGLTEQQAKQRSIEIKTGTFPLAANGKTIAYGAPEGFVKVVAGKKHGEILGVHMVGAHVTEMIAGAVGHIGLESTLDELSATIHPHPTISEAIMEAAHVAEGIGLHI